MNKKKLSLLFLTAMFTMLFSVGVMAATPNKVTGVKQTAATSTSIKVEWNSQLSCYYLLKCIYSADFQEDKK